MIRAILRSRASWVGAAFMVLSAAHLYIWGLLNLTPTITLVEAEWSISALVGAIYSADFIRDNVLDWRAAGRDSVQDEGNRLTLEIMLLIGYVLVGLHIMLLALGVFSMTRPTNPGNVCATRVIDAAFTVAGQALVGALMLIRLKRARLRLISSVEVLP